MQEHICLVCVCVCVCARARASGEFNDIEAQVQQQQTSGVRVATPALLIYLHHAYNAGRDNLRKTMMQGVTCIAYNGAMRDVLHITR